MVVPALPDISDCTHFQTPTTCVRASFTSTVGCEQVGSVFVGVGVGVGLLLLPLQADKIVVAKKAIPKNLMMFVFMFAFIYKFVCF
jgi:hypothetical protein